MTTRINMRNISHKNLTIEIKPRNDGSVTFLGDPPNNAIQENGGVKFTLATKKIDRGSIHIPSDMENGDLYINKINETPVGKNLIGQFPAFYDHHNCITPYSLAQLGIGCQWCFSIYNSVKDNYNDSLLVLVNNTNLPKIINGVVLTDAYRPGQITGGEGSMPEGSMTESMPEGSMVGSNSGFPGVFGEQIPNGHVSINLHSLKHAPQFQDPEANNPTFVQENGEWGMVLGDRNHRAGTYVFWKFQLPDDAVSQNKIMFYLPYRYTDKFNNVTDGQAVYIFSRTSNEVTWDTEFNPINLANDISSQIVGKDGIMVASNNLFTKEFTFNVKDGYPNWIGANNVPANYDQITEFNDPATLIGTEYQPTIGLSGQQYAIEFCGQTYVGIDKDLNDIQIDVIRKDPEAGGPITVPGMHYSDSTLELKPNDPVHFVEEIVPEEYIFINLARNTMDEDGLGFTDGNISNFIITSAGINNGNVWYNADGSEFIPPAPPEIEPPPPMILA